MAMLNTKIINRIEEVSSTEWNAVFPDVLDGYQFLKSLDESRFEQFSFYYILIYDNKKLVGAAPCFLVKYPLHTSVIGPIKQFSNFVKRLFPDAFTIKSMICGVPMSLGRMGISGDRAAIVKELVAAMDRLAKELKASIIAFKDFGRDYSELLDPLTEHGFIKMNSLPSAEIKIDFTDFEQYLMKLSHATRYDLRRKFKKVDGKLNMTMEVVSALDDDTLKEVYSLYIGAVREHEMGFEVVPMEFFSNIYKNMPDTCKFFLWRMDKKLVAFVFALVSKDFFNAYYLGLDYSIAYDYHLYFIRSRDIIKWCITNGIKKYDVGVTGYEPKKRLGFNFVPFYLYIKYRNDLIRPAFNFFSRFLRFENFDPVLKEIMKDIG